MAMNERESHYVGQRLSLKGHLLTVKYVGPVTGKSGTWLGVEWNDVLRGKNDGTFDGVRYFTCRSTSPTAASFLRPNQPWDPSTSFVIALRDKYMPDNSTTPAEKVYFSTKQAEEVGFEKFARRQAQLQGIHVLVLEQMQLRLPMIAENQIYPDGEEITKLCSQITDLDLSRNLIETTVQIGRLCRQFPKLRRLTLDGNQFAVATSSPKIDGVAFLSVSETLLNFDATFRFATDFPNLDHLIAANNELRVFGSSAPDIKFAHLRNLDLSGNHLLEVPNAITLAPFPNLKVLILKHNSVHGFAKILPSEVVLASSPLETIDLAHNQISTLTVLNDLPSLHPNVKHLRLTGNPVYTDLKSADGKDLKADDGYMLTIARLPQLDTLNYSKITDKERLNAETYYLSQIAVELTLASPDREDHILSHHPRWKNLCEEYGAPIIRRAVQVGTGVHPDSLAAKLVRITFALSSTTLSAEVTRTWTEDVPRSFNIYAVLGRVGKRLGVLPLELRLIWETGEQDPLGKDRKYVGPECWDSDDEDVDKASQHDQLVERQVELQAGTRPLGTYVTGEEARIRIELKR